MNPVIGGQAVMEGVMMKSPSHYSISVRAPNNEIKSKVEQLKSSRFKPFKWPIIRGFVQLVDMLFLGLKSLQWSANQQEETPEEEMTWKEYTFLLITSVGFAILLFIVVPLVLTNFITKSAGILFNLIDGVIRILIFIIYLTIISRMDDIKTLFQYHGAEHKVVNCYEANMELTIANAKTFTTSHPRCGTSFIMIVLVLSIILFSLIQSPSWLIKFLTRVIFIPIIAGISYEILHYSAKNKTNKILNFLIAPGLLLQKLTTREPNDNQLEIALSALSIVLSKTKRN